MSLFYELCRLCLNNCSSLGIIVCPEDFRHQKIRDCLSIIITDEQFKICSDCDGKLSCFYQFRIDSVRVQHEFADIMRSMQQPQYDSIYSSVYDVTQTVPNNTQDYPYHLDHELHLALDDNHSLISMPTNHNDSIYQQQVQTPSTPHIELQVDPVQNEPTPPPFDDFPYDDFDDSRESFPNDRNNVDNAIDKKIEEFIQNKRSKTNPKICTICNKLFRTNYKLREHMQTHENNAKFICEYSGCGKNFKSKIGLKEHSARHSGQYNFTCNVCQKQFLLRSYFLAHQKIHSTEKTFSCTMCSKTFKSKQNLVNHENVHYGLKAFTCNYCEKSFTTKTNLDVHTKIHEQQTEQFECNVCGKFFKTRAYLKVHTKTHYKSLQNYACHCGKTFIQLCDLKIHSKTHTNEKDFVCEICGDAFTRKDSLKHHVISAHTKDKFFNCSNCAKSFTRKTSLNKHLKKCLTDLNSSIL